MSEQKSPELLAAEQALQLAQHRLEQELAKHAVKIAEQRHCESVALELLGLAREYDGTELEAMFEQTLVRERKAAYETGCEDESRDYARRSRAIQKLLAAQDELQAKLESAHARCDTIEAETRCKNVCCTQQTQCAVCSKVKHTPLRRDEMGGFVCLTCVDHRLDGMWLPDGHGLDELEAEYSTLEQAVNSVMSALDTTSWASTRLAAGKRGPK